MHKLSFCIIVIVQKGGMCTTEKGCCDKLEVCLSNEDTWELLNTSALMLNMSHSSRANIILNNMTVNVMKRQGL